MEWSPTAVEAVLEKERRPAEREEAKQGKQQPMALAHTLLGGSAVKNGEVSPAECAGVGGARHCGWQGVAHLAS